LILLAISAASPARAGRGVVLVLSGGGTRGFAHVGVIEVLEEQGIPIAGIVGTSIGSLIGALKASGYGAAGIRDVVENLDLPALLSENTGPMFVFTGDDRRAKMNTISALTYKKSGKVGGPLGFLAGDKLFQYYTQLMRHVEVTDFSELPIPYAAIATDIQTGEKVVLRSGSLPSAMRASMSIPALFEPWEIDGRLLVDGGLVSNLPVDTARELFPGFPVIGVDVSDIPSRGRPIGTFIDVLDQSLSVVMRRATLDESERADLLITPDVQEFSFLEADVAGRIVERGRQAALQKIDRLKTFAGAVAEPPALPRPLLEPPFITDIVVQGLPESVGRQLRKQYLHWVGKPLDSAAVEAALAQLMAAPDIATVDYKLQNAKGPEAGRPPEAVLVLNVRRRPALEAGISGYTTNLDPYRWLYLKGTARGVFSEMDSLRAVIRAGKQWGIDLAYLIAPEPLNSWEFNLSAQNWEIDSSGGLRNWERYAVGGQYLFRIGSVRAGVGAAYEYADGDGVGSGHSAGPTFFAAYDTLDIPADPTEGQAWRLNVWWPDFDGLTYRLTWFKPVRVGEWWRTYLRLGYAEGNLERRGNAAYLGAAEELYSVADRPIEAERMAWANIAFRRILKRSALGIVAAEIFGSVGYAMDEHYEKVASPWEVGLALSIPNNFMNVKLAAMYGSEEFKIGFFLGVPIWDHYPLP
jgi:NTE family protein